MGARLFGGRQCKFVKYNFSRDTAVILYRDVISGWKKFLVSDLTTAVGGTSHIIGKLPI